MMNDTDVRDIYEAAIDEAIDILFTAHVQTAGATAPAILDAWAELFNARWAVNHPDEAPAESEAVK